MKIVNCEQGSTEWFDARLGHVTSSDIHRVIKKRKRGDGELQSRIDYKFEILMERLTRIPAEHFVSKPMEFGKTNEPLARTSYELDKETTVETVGYVLHPTIKMAGCSPDGLLGDDGLVELKVPNSCTHLEYLLTGIPPEEYLAQMMWQMACTGRQWCDFVSYDPRMPQECGLFVRRQYRDDKIIAEMESEVVKFLGEVDAMEKALPAHSDVSNLPSVPRAEIPNMESLNA